MILIDSSIIWALMSSSPSPALVDWANRHSHEIFLAAPELAELYSKIDLVPAGERRDLLRDRWEMIFEDALRTRIVDYTVDCAKSQVTLARFQSSVGGALEKIQSSAIAVASDAVIATLEANKYTFLEDHYLVVPSA